MATDYDAPRVRPEDEPENESLEQLRSASSRAAQSPNVDEVDPSEGESFDLPGADLSSEVLEIEVTPIQEDEQQCSSCHLIVHRAAVVSRDPIVCRDCA